MRLLRMSGAMRAIVVCTALAAFAAAAPGGCVPRRHQDPRAEPKPRELGPIEIDWSDPGSVVEGFFDAKKRGDWKKAYSCCDYEERLGVEEARKIRDAWKAEAKQWPDRYAHSVWLIAGPPDIDEEMGIAVVDVVRLDRAGPGIEDTKRSGFSELCKRYGDIWKITLFEVPPDAESE